MDAFKLLARSTSLQKTHGQQKPAESHLPSASFSSQPGLLTDEDGLNCGTKSLKTKKRKRESHPTAKEDATAADTTNVLDMLTPEGAEARRQILKKHKLKITLLDGQDNGTSRSASDKPRDKKHKNMLYPRPLVTFGDLHQRYHVAQRLVDNLSEQGFYTPTEVQMGAIPVLLGDANDTGLSETIGAKEDALHPDLLTVAPTGSGKTLAFLIPVIQKLLDAQHRGGASDKSSDRFVKAIVLAPTHELVDQIVNEGKKLCAGTGIKVAPMRKSSHIAQADRKDFADDKAVIKADILVSTPMMIFNAINDQDNETSFTLGSVLHLVLDEADVLLDPLFHDQTIAIWQECMHVELRVSLWSATIGSSIEAKAQAFIASRMQELGSKRRHPLLRLIVGLKDSSLPTIAHRMIYAATEQGKLLALRELLHPSTAASSTKTAALRPPFLVFTQTIQRAKALFSELLYDIPVEAGGSERIAVLHSELPENVRSNIMSGFRKGEIWIIITTDLLSRGVDFKGVNGIVNYDIPNTGAAYVHRAGRTGRAGREGGVAVTLYTKEDIPYVKNIANVIAASEKAHGKTSGTGIEKWLLDALPKVTKKARKELKQKGVAARRTTQKDADTPREARRARIGTKSGYERRLEHRRKGAIDGQLRRTTAQDDQISDGSDGWEGIDE